MLETLYNLPITAYQYVEEPEVEDEPAETPAGFFTLDDVVAEIKTLNGRLRNIEDLVDYLAAFVEWFRGAAERAGEDLKEATDAVVEIATRTEG